MAIKKRSTAKKATAKKTAARAPRKTTVTKPVEGAKNEPAGVHEEGATGAASKRSPVRSGESSKVSDGVTDSKVRVPVDENQDEALAEAKSHHPDDTPENRASGKYIPEARMNEQLTSLDQVPKTHNAPDYKNEDDVNEVLRERKKKLDAGEPFTR